MKVIHFAENSTKVEVVELLAHQVSPTNRLSVIRNEDGKIMMTGGHLINYTPTNLDILNLIPKDDLYNFILLVKMTATSKDVKEYYSLSNEFKKGDVITACVCHGMVYKDDAALTKGKKYVATEDSKGGMCGNLVRIIDDKNREILTLTNHFETKV